jgi:hypothetical protein
VKAGIPDIRPVRVPTTLDEAGFQLHDIVFSRQRNAPETLTRQGEPVINNGVDTMTTILQLIYREYCRACLMHFRYL